MGIDERMDLFADAIGFQPVAEFAYRRPSRPRSIRTKARMAR